MSDLAASPSAAPPTPGLRVVPPTETESPCKLCFLPAQEPDSGIDLGPLYEYVVDPESEIYRAHYSCLLFSSGLEQVGEEDEQLKGKQRPVRTLTFT